MAGEVPGSPLNVPVPRTEKLHSRYAPMEPAPAALMASRTPSTSFWGTKTVTFRLAPGVSAGRSG